MDKELKPNGSPSPELQDAAGHSFQSDLQYVSVQVDGATYGGWYRLLPDGRMELLALANMHSEHRPEGSPLEQARGMLTDFIRATRSKHARNDTPPTLLGDVIYADKLKPRIPERDWATLVLATAAGEVPAFNGLFQRTHHLVFTLILRLTRDRETARELTLKVFEALWQRAPTYDPAGGSVLAWVMNQARSTAIAHLALMNRSTLEGEDDQRSEADSDSSDICALPAEFLWDRLAQRITLSPDSSAPVPWIEPTWEEVAPGISCKLLATDVERDRVSMLVRLTPGTDYPGHRHAGVEELHLLHGELWIDAKKLYPGDYNRAEPGTQDERVWSETGCTCVLVTSTRDVLK